MNNGKKQEWQIEGLHYKNAHSFYLSCEKSKDVPNTLYLIEKSKLVAKSNK
jgi:hypothetical protein